MKCPKCNVPTEVKDTRIFPTHVTRRRVCYNMHTFKTEEKPITEPKEKKDD